MEALVATWYKESCYYRCMYCCVGTVYGCECDVLFYGPSIFENAGLSGGDSLFYQVLVGLVNTLTTVLALVIIDKVGRKKLVYYGVSGMVISFLVLIATYFIYGESWGISSIFPFNLFPLLCILLCSVYMCCGICASF